MFKESLKIILSRALDTLIKFWYYWVQSGSESKNSEFSAITWHIFESAPICQNGVSTNWN